MKDAELANSETAPQTPLLADMDSHYLSRALHTPSVGSMVCGQAIAPCRVSIGFQLHLFRMTLRGHPDRRGGADEKSNRGLGCRSCDAWNSPCRKRRRRSCTSTEG